jgi:uncharacterized membrane protein
MFDAVMHWIGFGLCHQLPARSFIAGGHQLPVCARDTGIYLGFVVSLAIIGAFERGRRRTGMPPAWLLGVGVALIVAMAWDGVTSYAGLRATTNFLRLATGTGAGFALALVVAPVLNQQLWKRGDAGRILGQPVQGAVWCLAVPTTLAALWWGGPLLGAGYAVLVALAILATFTAVNLIVVSLLPPFEHAAARLRDAWPALLISLGVTVIELATAGWLRLLLLRLVSQR